ncbi:MAG TPA: hypothetical protein VK162_15575, partial [Streptosporangiaceae bacterium]|nr:hypothetical protein [Streptosporangiaceae bacterium]
MMIEGTNSGPEQNSDRADTGADDRAEVQAEQPEHRQVEASGLESSAARGPRAEPASPRGQRHRPLHQRPVQVLLDQP